MAPPHRVLGNVEEEACLVRPRSSPMVGQQDETECVAFCASFSHEKERVPRAKRRVLSIRVSCKLFDYPDRLCRMKVLRVDSYG